MNLAKGLVAALALVATAPLYAQSPPSFQKPKPIARPNPSLPAPFKQAHAGETVSGSYKICIVPEGTVDAVTAVDGIPGADPTIIDHLRTRWRYEPLPFKTCVLQKFTFKIPPPQPIKIRPPTGAPAQR